MVVAGLERRYYGLRNSHLTTELPKPTTTICYKMWPIISKGTLRSAYLVLRYRQNKLAKYDENNKNKSCIFDNIFKSISSNCTNKVSF